MANTDQTRFIKAAERLWGTNGYFDFELEELKFIILEAEERGKIWARIGSPLGVRVKLDDRPLGRLE